MSRLQQIASERHGSIREKLDAARQEERRRTQSRAKAKARAQKGAMKAALAVTGRVIFPGRWEVVPSSRSHWHYRCTARWEGLLLECEWRPGSQGAEFTELAVRDVANSRVERVGSPDELAAVIIDWGLV